MARNVCLRKLIPFELASDDSENQSQRPIRSPYARQTIFRYIEIENITSRKWCEVIDLINLHQVAVFLRVRKKLYFNHKLELAVTTQYEGTSLFFFYGHFLLTIYDNSFIFNTVLTRLYSTERRIIAIHSMISYKKIIQLANEFQAVECSPSLSATFNRWTNRLKFSDHCVLDSTS